MVAILGIDDQVACGQEFVGQPDRLIEVAARITAQVEDQLVHALPPQRVQGVGELAVCGLGELRELDETDVVADDEGRFDAAQGNHVAHDLHLHRLPDALPSERETHFRAARPPQPPDDPLLRNPLSGYQRVVDAQDAVAGPHARAVARPRRDDVEHDHRIGSHIEYHADAVELPFERLVHALHLRRGNVGRVGIELRNQQGDHPFGERVHRDRIDPFALDQGHRVGELVGRQAQPLQYVPHAGFQAVAAQELAQQQPGDDARCQQQGKEDGTAGVAVHVTCS